MTAPVLNGYPFRLGLASFLWAPAAWTLALFAPHMAFLPGVEALHLLLPTVTVVLILLNLAFAVRSLRGGVRADALMTVTALQIGLFTALFFQIASHLGPQHFKLTEPTTGGQWVQFSLAHALKASDVLDTIEAYGFDVQVIKHRSPLVATLLVLYHIVVDLFVLGVLWSFVGVVKRRVMSKPERADVLRMCLTMAMLYSVAGWLVLVLVGRPWRLIDIPLWLGENVVRVLDFSDAMDSYDIHWHQVPKEWLEATLTFLCRVWIALGIGLLANRAERVSTTETPSVARLARLGLVAILFGLFNLAHDLTRPGREDAVSSLLVAVRDRDEVVATAAQNALRRMGPNAEVAVEPLTELLACTPNDKRTRLIDTISHLGPKALPLLELIADGPDESLATAAVVGLDRVGADAAPALVRLWKSGRSDAIRSQADASLRNLGSDAMPKLIDACTEKNSADLHHWFEQLDRNWVLRSSTNGTFESLTRWTRAQAKGEPDVYAAGNSGAVAVPYLRQIATGQLKFGKWDTPWHRLQAIEALGKLGPLAAAACPDLLVALHDPSPEVREAAAVALGQIGVRIEGAVQELITRMADTDGRVRSAATSALVRNGAPWIDRSLGKGAATGLLAPLLDTDAKIRQAAADLLGKMGSAAGDTVPGLIAVLIDTDEKVVRSATKALEAIDPKWRDSPAAQAAFSKLAAKVLKLGVEANASNLVPGLIALLSDTDREVVRVADKTLEAIDPKWRDSPAVEAVVLKLITKFEARFSSGEDKWGVTVFALGRIGANAKAALPALYDWRRYSLYPHSRAALAVNDAIARIEGK